MCFGDVLPGFEAQGAPLGGNHGAGARGQDFLKQICLLKAAALYRLGSRDRTPLWAGNVTHAPRLLGDRRAREPAWSPTGQ